MATYYYLEVEFLGHRLHAYLPLEDTGLIVFYSGHTDL